MVLALFFTRGVSLETWVTQGLFDREKLIYEEHLNQENLKKVYWFTYGSNDKELSEQLKKENRLHPNIEVYQMPKILNIPKIGSFIYSFILPFIYNKALAKSNIFKTNQMDGSWSAVIAKWLYNKPLVIRTGYTLSQLEYSKNKNSFRYIYYTFIEKHAYSNCNIAFVTSKNNKDYLENKSYLSSDNSMIITNFIDINLFKPLNLEKYNNRILFVGRLNKEKNLFNLIDAISKTDLILDIYGQGELEDELKLFAKKLNAKVNFLGIVENKKLAQIYNQYKYYILPSYFEGMPKTLLEAMACGCICIGTDVNGINEVIKDGVNGYLSKDIDSNSLLLTINKVINIDNIKIIKNGITNIKDNFSLEFIVNREKSLLELNV